MIKRQAIINIFKSLLSILFIVDIKKEQMFIVLLHFLKKVFILKRNEKMNEMASNR